MAFYASFTTAVSMALLLVATSAASAAAHDGEALSSTSNHRNGQAADALALKQIEHDSVTSGSARQAWIENQEVDAHATSHNTNAEAAPSGSGKVLQSAFKEHLDNAIHTANRMLVEKDAAPAPAPILVDFPGGGVQVSDQGVHVQFPGGQVNIGRKLKGRAI